MKKSLFARRIIGMRLLAVYASLLLSASMVHGQSVDDVHIQPPSRTGGHQGFDSGILETPPADPIAMSSPLRVSVDVVLVPVTVSDANNRPVTTLNRNDFVLYEGNKQQEIRYFSTEESPLSIAILFDVSKSMVDKIESERAALVEFFNNANPADEYFAITFSDRPRLLASSTQSIDELQTKLLSTKTGGPTAMLDAIYLAESKLRSSRYERKAIVIISDGGDNVSRYTLREIKSLVQESDVQIYAIGLFDTFILGTLEEKLGKMWLSEITDASGGRTVTVDNRAKLPEAAAQISREMRNQYILGYRPEAATVSKWNKIRVNVTEPATERRLRAYYKRGYLSVGKTQGRAGKPL